MKINGKEFEVNMDVTLETQMLMGKIREKNELYYKYIFKILRDILIPTPDNKQMMKFRNSDIERVFTIFTGQANDIDNDFKKKLS